MTKISADRGMVEDPKRTAVPGGEDIVAFILTAAAVFSARDWTENVARKPVLFLLGSPLTVENSFDSSLEKKTWEIVLVGPIGGVTCPRLKRRRLSIALIPCLENEEQLTPALAPVHPTQTRRCFIDAVTVVGKSPGTATGLPTIVRFVGSSRFIANMETVLDPALTAKRCYKNHN